MSDRNNSTHGTSAAETFTKYGTGSNGKFLCNKKNTFRCIRIYGRQSGV